MKEQFRRLLNILFYTALCSLYPLSAFTSTEPDDVTKMKILSSGVRYLPSFIGNKGQIDNKVSFYLPGKQETVYFTKEGVVYALKTKKGHLSNKTSPIKKDPGSGEFKRLSFSLKPLGANKNVRLFAKNKLPGKVNYLIGKDPGKWQKDISVYKEIIYKNLYKNIDLRFYVNNNQVEYDFIVYPGGDPEDINMVFDGVEALRIDKEGNLIIRTPLGKLKHLKPHIYQNIEDKDHLVEGSFRVAKTTFTFECKIYDKNYPLVIDPLTLSFSTYLGGSEIDYSSDIAVDPSGNIYITGNTNSSNNFPTDNAYDETYGGGDSDFFIVKMDSSGNVLYSTYLGGNDYDLSSKITIDSSGNAYVTGVTYSSNFPVKNAFQGTRSGGYDAFVTKINSSGSDLIYSTYLGGNGYESATIAIDSSGNAYVAGVTSSSNFPVKNAFQGTRSGGYDAFVTKINSSGSDLIYSTYLGGNGDESVAEIAIDSSGNAYVTGVTYSSDFPISNAFQATRSGNYDAFVTKINSSGSDLSYSTYLGGNGYESVAEIALDSSGNAYVAGLTYSSNFPVKNAFQSTCGGDSDAFVTKINSSGSDLTYSTYLGGNNDETSSGITLDSSGNAYVAGLTNSSNFPVKNAFQSTRGGDYDVFVTKIDPTGTDVIYSTYLGGNGDDSISEIIVDSSGCAYVTGETYSSNFPISNAFQATRSGNSDAFVTKLKPFEGIPLYSTYLGGSRYEGGSGIIIDPSGYVYVTGWTTSTNFPLETAFQGTYGGGDYDAFVTKVQFPSLSISISPPCITAGSPVTITVDTPESGYYFKYWINETSYCSEEPANWTLIKDWTTDKTATWTPVTDGRKTVVVWVTEDTASSCPKMIGTSYEVGSSNCKDAINVSLEPATGGVNDEVTIIATGSESSLYYRFWVNNNSYCSSPNTPSWQIIQDWSSKNCCTWTPVNPGDYTIVIWTTDDINNECVGMGGMTYKVE